MNGHFTPWSEGGSQGQAFYVRFETFVGWTVRPQHMMDHLKVLLRVAFGEMQNGKIVIISLYSLYVHD